MIKTKSGIFPSMGTIPKLIIICICICGKRKVSVLQISDRESVAHASTSLLEMMKDPKRLLKLSDRENVTHASISVLKMMKDPRKLLKLEFSLWKKFPKNNYVYFIKLLCNSPK